VRAKELLQMFFFMMNLSLGDVVSGGAGVLSGVAI
jgi:hypothetical protein